MKRHLVLSRQPTPPWGEPFEQARRRTSAGGAAIPTSRNTAHRWAQVGGGVRGTIDPSCEPDPLPLAPGPPGRLSKTGGRDGKNRARYARFFFAPLCGATTKTAAGKGPPRTPG